MIPFESALATDELLAIFDEREVVQAMLDFEAALARAQGKAGVIPPSEADAIAAACRVERFDTGELVRRGRVAGTLAIPLVAALREAAGPHAHHGTTSQDVLDSAMAILTRRALAVVDRDLAALIAALLHLGEAHVDTPQLGRTLLQPAQAITFGLEVVSWVAPLVRRQARIRAAAQGALQLQLGGPAGTFDRDDVVRLVAGELKLAVPDGAWHTQRDEQAALGGELGVLCGALGKLARDIALLSQVEVGEVAEPWSEGRGASTAMPHKRNPVASMVALAASLRAPQRVAALLAAMPQEHERGLGGWPAELAEWSALLVTTGGALAAMLEAARGLTVDAERMRRNLEPFGGDPRPAARLARARLAALRVLAEEQARERPFA
jgi:3-carboxy-cis,cis-muconate cycloisomerase